MAWGNEKLQTTPAGPSQWGADPLQSTPQDNRDITQKSGKEQAEAYFEHPATGNIEAGLEMASGALTTPVAGLAGLAQGAINYGKQTLGLPQGMPADERIHQVQEAGTYHPQSESGKVAAATIGKLPAMAGKFLTEQGENAAQASGYPALGAAVTAIPQVMLSLAAPETRGAMSSVVRGGRAAQAAEAATGRFGAPTAQEAAAAQYAARNGVDWGSLTQPFRDTLTRLSKQQQGLEGLDPVAFQRVAKANSIKVPMSRGAATRDPAQITIEENLIKAPSGQPLRDIQAQQDTALHDALQGVRRQVAPGSKIETSADVGRPVQAASRRKLQVLKGAANRAYEEARRSGALTTEVDATDLMEWAKKPENARNAGYISSAIKDYAVDGKITIENMEKIRQEASAHSKSPNADAHYAGEAKNVIDHVLDSSGNDVFKDARSKWRDWKKEFTQQKIVRDLTSEKGGVTDRKVALEKTADYIIGSDNEALGTLKQSLTTGGTEATRRAGARAWRDVQSGVIQKLAEEAAGKRMIKGAKDQLQFNSSFLDRFYELDRSGKLETLFGKQASEQLRKIAEVTHDVRTKPADRIAGPNTAARLISAFETISGHIMKVPGLKQVSESIKEGKAIRNASEDPVTGAIVKPTKRGRVGQTLKSLRGPALSTLPTTMQTDQGSDR